MEVYAGGHPAFGYPSNDFTEFRERLEPKHGEVYNG